jgi:hypothetical protein
VGNENPCKAGGVMFYRHIKNDIELLMINMNGRYEDFGGKTDPRDASIKETIAREVFEESNGVFTRGFVHSQIKGKGVYMRSGKYLLYFIELHERIDVSKFGTIETTEQIPRTVEWIESNLFLSRNINIHPRLRSPLIFSHIFSLVRKIQVSAQISSRIYSKEDICSPSEVNGCSSSLFNLLNHNLDNVSEMISTLSLTTENNTCPDLPDVNRQSPCDGPIFGPIIGSVINPVANRTNGPIFGPVIVGPGVWRVYHELTFKENC